MITKVKKSIKALVVYKHSRFAYAKEQEILGRDGVIFDEANPITKSLLLAHQKNLLAIDHVVSVLNRLHIPHEVICRSDLSLADTEDRLVISVGGDGTLLDASHHCKEAPILGVNSDPDSSMGALCAASLDNFERICQDICDDALKPTPLARLAIFIDGKKLDILALNDLLFCHRNPAAMSRFSVSLRGETNLIKGSGLWVATAAGSTGAICSAGAKPLSLDRREALFRLREPYSMEKSKPKLLQGILEGQDELVIQSHMSDAAIFIDGPHKTWDIKLGQSIGIGLASKPLWLYVDETLYKNRGQIIEERLRITKLLSEGGRFC